MRKVLLSVTLGALVLLWAAQAHAGQRGAGGASFECWQFGVPATQVVAANEFAIRGAGFRPDLPVWVCIFSDTCVLSEVDGTGVFSQNRSLVNPGTFTVTVSQARNRQLDNWTMKVKGQITVTN